MTPKFIVEPNMIFGLQSEVDKNLRSAFNKQNSDFTDCLKGFLKMPMSKRKEIFGIKSTFGWDEQQEKISIFYVKVRDILEMPAEEIDWNLVTIPEYSEDFSVLEYIDRSITGKQWIQVYKKLFGEKNVCSNDCSNDIEKVTKEQQSRPEGNYCITRRKTIEPDKAHLKKSYDDFHNDNKKYMVPIEGIISALRYRMETGNMLDVKGITRFHALYSENEALRMGRCRDGSFGLDCYYREDLRADDGPREVNF